MPLLPALARRSHYFVLSRNDDIKPLGIYMAFGLLTPANKPNHLSHLNLADHTSVLGYEGSLSERHVSAITF